jgi:hypothetical protein
MTEVNNKANDSLEILKSYLGRTLRIKISDGNRMIMLKSYEVIWIDAFRDD